MRDVEWDIEEKRPILVLVDKFQAALYHHLWEILPIGLHRRRPLVEIVEPGTVQEVVVEVVDETIADPKELVETLLLRSEIAMRAEMPLSE